MSVLRVAKEDGLATVTLDRPDKLNALSRELRTAVERAFRELQDDADVRVVVLTGAGRAFSAGIDLVELGGESADDSGAGERSMIAALHDFEGPIIGAINGHAITGGFELALACDVLVASTKAVFGDTHARVGIVPGWGLSQKLPRMIGISRAKEMAFTGNFIDAEQAERWGLVNRVVEPDALLPTCRQLALDMLSCDPPSLRTYKQMIDRGYEATFGEGLRLEREMSRAHLKEVPAGAVEARRAGIQQRGRRQQGE
ncbi:MAG: enoyl-CoA hydratase [Myxococcota bacterium]